MPPKDGLTAMQVSENSKRPSVGNMDAVLINGTQLLLDCIYDNIGFNRIPDEILRHLVIARVSQPVRRIEAHMFAFALSPIKYIRNWSELSKKRTLT